MSLIDLESLRGNRTYAVAIATALTYAAAWFADPTVDTHKTLEALGGVGLSAAAFYLRAGKANDTQKVLDAIAKVQQDYARMIGGGDK